MLYKVFEIGTDPFALEQRLNQLASDGWQLKTTLQGHPGQYNAAGVYMDRTWSPSMLIVEKPDDLVAHIVTLIDRMPDAERLRLIDCLSGEMIDPLLNKNGRRLRYIRGGRA
jgi:hypothetical protein